MTVVEQPMTLERAIEREINLGQKDPHEVYDRLEKALGGEELVRLAAPHIPDLVSEMARQRISQQRRQAVAKISNATIGDPEIMLRSLWVPSDDGKIVYKRIADMDATDFEDRAAYLERLVVGISRHAQWCRDVAQVIRKQKVGKAGDLKRLPELPELAA